MTNVNSRSKVQNLPLTTPLFIVALSLALNLHTLSAHSFWGDEILTATFAGRTPAEVIGWTAEDIHPPLYYLLVGNFAKLTVPLGLTQAPTAVSDWLWRFPSVIAVVLTIAVTYKLAYHISRITHHESSFTQHVSRITCNTSHHIAFSAALLLALAPIAIKYGQEARMHALFMLLSAFSTWLLFRALARPRQWPRWLAFALITTANIYTMYFGFLILAAQAGLLLFRILNSEFRTPALRAGASVQKSNSPLRASGLIGFATAIGLASLLYLPWWPVLFNLLRKRAAVGAIEGGVGQPLDFVRGVVQSLGPMPEPIAWGFLLLYVIGLIFLIRHHWPLAGFAGLWLGLPVALPIVLGDPRALQFRYAFVLPVYLTTVAYTIWKVGIWVSGLVAPNTKVFRKQSPTEWDLSQYFLWILGTLSFVAALEMYHNQIKPDWRSAAAYLDAQANPADIILIGPLWDEGRFIGYYYQGEAQLLTPAALVTNIERRIESMRARGTRVWAVSRFAPTESAVSHNVIFPGVVLSEPTLAVYEPELLTEAAIDLAAQAVDAAYPWAAEAEAQGVLDPDPRTAQAVALRALGDVLVAAGRPAEALTPYQTAVDIFPGWVSGFIVLAETHEAIGNLSAAAEAYRQAVAFNLDWQGAQAVEATSLIEAGQWQAALEKYHQIIRSK